MSVPISGPTTFARQLETTLGYMDDGQLLPDNAERKFLQFYAALGTRRFRPARIPAVHQPSINPPKR